MSITVAQMETALGGLIGDPHVIRYFGAVATFQEWLIHGNQTVPGRVRMIRTTATDNAATQADAVLTALRA